jgi:outer membrane receptor protein involved in Fe transport
LIGLYHSSLKVDDLSGGKRNITLARLGVPRLLVLPRENGGFGLPQNYADQILSLYADVNPVQLSTYGKVDQKITSNAIFADVTYKINAQWDILAGIRWDSEKQENSADRKVTVENGHLLPDPTNLNFDPTTAQVVSILNAQLYKQADDASGIEPLVDTSFDAVLPKLGVSYHISDDMTTSFIFQKGYRSGGVGTNIAQATTHTFDSEYTSNYELSFRSIWLDGSLTANANMFYIDWKDQQVNVQLGVSQYDKDTRNVGSSVVKGFEAELRYQVNNNLTLSAGLGQSKTEFKDFPLDKIGEVSPNLSGFGFRDSPEWTANLSATYVGDNGFFANINANYVDESRALSNPFAQGKVVGDTDFDPMDQAVTLVNTRIGYEWDTVGLYLTVTNLLDKEYLSDIDTGYDVETYGAPRQAALKFQVDF